MESTTVDVNGLSSLNVYISGSEDLAQFSFKLGITPDAGVTSTLKFVEDTGYATDGNYVFFGDPDTDPFQNLDAGDSQVSIDDAASGNVTLSSTEKLIGRIGLQHSFAGDPALAIGDTFTIDFINTADPGITYFEDSDFDTFTPLFTSGTVTVTGGAAIPEPGSFALLGLCGAAMLFLRRRQTRKASDLEVPTPVV